ncbi:MAG: GIY-YIG nuclease family protein [Acidobacteriota bacterium]
MTKSDRVHQGPRARARERPRRGNQGHNYVGTTANVDERLEWHNDGPVGDTVNHRPWRVVVSLEFPSEEAARFERYLKSASGRACAKRHFALA